MFFHYTDSGFLYNKRIGLLRAEFRIQAALIVYFLPLLEEAEPGNFRPDLYYRLSVFKIRVPALRERQEDIPLLAQHFLQFYAAKMNHRLTGMNEEFMQKLKAYPWKGNIRELKNVMERAGI